MKNNEIIEIWTLCITHVKYQHLFFNKLEKWYQKLENVKIYFLEHNKCPSSKDNDIVGLGRWLVNNMQNY